MVSLPARLPRPGRGDRPRQAGLLAAAAALAVTGTGLLGLWVALVVVQALDPGGGLSGGATVRVAGQLWLLAHGGELRLDSGPLVLAPLLLTLAVAWGLARAGGAVVRAREVTAAGQAALTAGTVVLVHVLLVLAVALAVDVPGAQVALPRTTVGSLVLATLAAGWGVLRESGQLDDVLDRLPGAARPLLRAVLTGQLALMALGSAVVAVALATDSAGYAALSRSLGGAGAGSLGLLALGALLVPNAAAAVIGLAAGPGFLVGTATQVSVHGVSLGAVPALPLLAALPDTQAVPLLAFGSQILPALAGLLAGVALGRRFTDGGAALAGCWGIVAGVLLGVASAALVWVAGGQLGDGGLAEVGAPALATGLAIGVQTGIAAAVGAAIARWRTAG